MASLREVLVPISIRFEGQEEALDQLALIKALEKVSARNRQLDGDLKRALARAEKAEKQARDLASMNAQLRFGTARIQNGWASADGEIHD